MTLRQIRYLLWALSGLLIVLMAAILGWNLVVAPRLGPETSAGKASIGGPFEMISSGGESVDRADFLGRPTVMFFGFTSCPDVCPTTLFEMTQLMERLGGEADEMNFVFVSVDSERDTPQRLEEYLKAFDPRIQGLTGTPQQLEDMAEAYRIYYRRVPTDEGYTMEHTSRIYLLDSRGEFVDSIAYGESLSAAFEKLQQLARSP